MDSLQLTPIASFFFFALLDETKAKNASRVVYKECLRSMQDFVAPREVHIVAETHAHWKKLKQKRGHEHSPITMRAGFKMPAVDLGPWKQFHKEAEDDELLSVIWSCILNFSDEHIAMGVQTTPGTIRHRVGRGLKRLGQFRFVGRLGEP